jgi:uncharacterized OB-fold protein
MEMAQAPPSRPLPSVTEPDTGPFWAATKDHHLTYQWCDRCGQAVFFRRIVCPGCGGRQLDTRVSAGEGTIYTYTVMRQHMAPFFRSILPYVVAFIDLAEGFRMMAGVITDDVDSVAVGQPVRLEWEDHDDCAIPMFRVVS